MVTLLNDIDPALWKLAAFVFGGYFLWSMKSIFKDLKTEINELKTTIEKLFAQDNALNQRISRLEGRMNERKEQA